MRTRHGLAVLCAAALLGGASARAEEPGLTALRGRVDALEQQVRTLQAQVKKLEGGAAAAPVAPATSAAPSAKAPSSVPVAAGTVTPEAALRQRWAEVEAGTPSERVAELLGEPSARFQIDGRNVWYYAYPGTGSGSVFFTDQGKVSSSQSPFRWGW